MAGNRKQAAPRSKGGKKKGGLSLWLRLLIFVVILAILAIGISYLVIRSGRKQSPGLNEIKVNKELPLKTPEKVAKKEAKPQGVKESASTEKQKKPATKESPASASIIGTWVSTENGSMLTVKKNTYSIDFPSVEYRKPMQGAISISTNAFTVINESDDKECGIEPGTYSFKFVDDNLIISRKKDPCKKRTSSLEASWFRL
ncbi:MAG: hypothetical protein KKD74_13745 [Bacteroidetes bacterium]|nr:hypothetical protein [Bacteroidota bacterium]